MEGSVTNIEDVKRDREMKQMSSQFKVLEATQDYLYHAVAAAIDNLIRVGFSEPIAEKHVIGYLDKLVMSYDLDR